MHRETSVDLEWRGLAVGLTRSNFQFFEYFRVPIQNIKEVVHGGNRLRRTRLVP